MPIDKTTLIEKPITIIKKELITCNKKVPFTIWFFISMITLSRGGNNY